MAQPFENQTILSNCCMVGPFQWKPSCFNHFNNGHKLCLENGHLNTGQLFSNVNCIRIYTVQPNPQLIFLHLQYSFYLNHTNKTLQILHWKTIFIGLGIGNHIKLKHT
jgi:hypothetical protein